MQHHKFLSILKAILQCPTAPFHEYHVRAKIEELLAPAGNVSLETDGFGNLIAHYKRGKAKARYAIGSHMDHPGWVRKPATASGPAPEPPRAEVAPDDDDEETESEAETPAEAAGVAASSDPDAAEVSADNAGNADGDPWEFLGGVPEAWRANGTRKEFGEFGMWDLPDFRLGKDGAIYSRACDDLVGCAVIVAVLLELDARGIECSCYGLFTRAEEVGFVGAVKMARKWPLPKGVAFISLETSAPAGEAVMGQGPVIRVGDRTSVFTPGVTAELMQAAADARVPVQRKLLDRGTCEATALQLFGIPTGGISILLGNYHNCAPEEQIDSESVMLADVKAAMKLLVATMANSARWKGKGAPAPGPLTPALKTLRQSLKKRVKAHAPYAKATKKHFKPKTAK